MKTRLFFCVLAISLSAAVSNAQTGIGILGGVNFQNLNGKDFTGDKLENQLIPGFHAGLNMQVPIAPEFYFQPGLLFSTKGGKNPNGLVVVTNRLSYIELPLNLVYKGQLGNGYVVIGFGPYIAYALGGKAVFENGGDKDKADILFQNVVEITDPLFATYFRALDAGGNIFAGYETGGGIFFQLNTQLGMLEINPVDKRIPNDKSVVRNTGFGLSAGYRF